VVLVFLFMIDKEAKEMQMFSGTDVMSELLDELVERIKQEVLPLISERSPTLFSMVEHVMAARICLARKRHELREIVDQGLLPPKDFLKLDRRLLSPTKESYEFFAPEEGDLEEDFVTRAESGREKLKQYFATKTAWRGVLPPEKRYSMRKGKGGDNGTLLWPGGEDEANGEAEEAEGEEDEPDWTKEEEEKGEE
jgi:hypothetical protein